MNPVDSLLAWLAPWRCILCRDPAHGMDICADCCNDLPWLAPGCQRCGLPLPASGARLCGTCQQMPPAIDHCIAALSYEYPVDRLVTALKYQRKLIHARVLAELLGIRLREALVSNEIKSPTLLMMVPLHRRRLIQRGFNQSELLARWLATNLAVPFNPAGLRRVRHTPPQTSLSRAARLQNIRNAFELRTSVVQQRVALVDDVITTGATVRELAQLLKTKGAAEVQVWAVARTAG